MDPDCDYLFVVGHRGAYLHAPENTLIGFAAAETLGVDVVEVDVRATADGILVAMHDSSVDRTTNGTGDVDQLTLTEIRGLVAVSDFPEIDDQPIPTFVEVLEALGPTTLINVDAKTSRWDLIEADLRVTGKLGHAWVQTDDLTETEEVVAGWPDLILMPDAETVAEIEALTPHAPATIEIPNTVIDPAPFEACHAAGIKPAQNALGFADTGALVDAADGGDGSQAYRALADLGAAIVQTDVAELAVPAFEAMNAERGWTRP